jgi:hypothetical protein
MPSKGRELSDLNPSFDEFSKESAKEPPLSEQEATGGIPAHRYRREVARWVWKYIFEYESFREPLPSEVIKYLKSVATMIERNLGPNGSLSQKGAWGAIGIDGKSWSEHSPILVYLAMQNWIDGEFWPKIKGPKAAAVRYIDERMGGDREALPETIIRQYKEGKRLWLSDK